MRVREILRYAQNDVDLTSSIFQHPAGGLLHSAKYPSYPGAWPVLEGDVRRSLVNRFPYGVLYSIEEERIYILAIMHLHRYPDYWKNRR